MYDQKGILTNMIKIIQQSKQYEIIRDDNLFDYYFNNLPLIGDREIHCSDKYQLKKTL